MEHCRDLAPSSPLLAAYKAGRINEAEYSREYINLLNGRGKTAAAIIAGLPEGAILCCYEKPPKFCHRHLAAVWLMAHAPTLSVTISEMKP